MIKKYSRIEDVLAVSMSSKEAMNNGCENLQGVEPGYMVRKDGQNLWMDKKSFESKYVPMDTDRDLIDNEGQLIGARLQELDEHLRGGISRKHCDETLSCLMNMENALKAYQFWLGRLGKQLTETGEE